MPSGKRVYDARHVEDDRNRHGKHDELRESGDLLSEQEEDRYDPDDAQEQWSEPTVQVGNEPVCSRLLTSA
jgi:hypothetical protein